MSAYFEIAYATASHQLCLFTGTGFSKAVTENSAPSWKFLLETMCDKLTNGKEMKLALFQSTGGALSLEESAQVIAIEYAKNGLDIHQEIASVISDIKLSGDNKVIKDFFHNNSLRVVTTNYDKLAEDLADAKQCHSIAPGMPVPRSQAKVKIYHVHGSISSPENMVVTSDDYFQFINAESYFSRKLSTLLHENTVVILGYSLGDINLKAIINDYKKFSRNQAISGNIFFVSKSKIDQHIKDYYSHCYGIRVLDMIGIHQFFKNITAEMPAALECSASTIENINQVLFNNKTFTEKYLKVESSFFKIIASVSAIGRSINDPSVVTALEKIIRKKIELTAENGAWEQYGQLARWLIHLGSILELNGTTIKDTYLEAVLKSMNTMSKKQIWGFSWDAYKAWDQKWPEVISTNRSLIKKHIEDNSNDADAQQIVARM
jgi:hypothetical protein